MKRESGYNPERAHRCTRGQIPHVRHCDLRETGRRGRRMIRKSEDLPEKSVCLSAVTNQPIFCGHFITVFYAVLACINDKVMFERRLIFNHAESLPSWIIGNEYVILWIQRDIPGSITLMAFFTFCAGPSTFRFGEFFPLTSTAFFYRRFK